MTFEYDTKTGGCSILPESAICTTGRSSALTVLRCAGCCRNPTCMMAGGRNQHGVVENNFLIAALDWWTPPRLGRPPLTLSRLVVGGAATPNEAALACSSAALIPRTIRGQAEAAARSPQLPTAPSPHSDTPPQPPTDLCAVLCAWPCREPVVAVRGGREGLDELPSDLGWLLMCGDPGERQEELSTPRAVHHHHHHHPSQLVQ